MIMSHRFLFDRINVTREKLAVGKKLQLSPDVLPNPAETYLAFSDLTMSSTCRAHYSAIGNGDIELGLLHISTVSV